MIQQIIGIDNDMSFGELKLDEKKSVAHLTALKDSFNQYAMAAVDKEILAGIMNLTPEILQFSLMDLVGEESINALGDRLLYLQSFLKENTGRDKIRVLTKDSGQEWNEALSQNPSSYLRYE